MILDFGNKNTLDFFKKLEQNQVEYLLIGGWAVNYHGFTRATQDIDIWLAPTNLNKTNFCTTLLDIGYTEDEILDIKEQDFTQHFKCTVWLDNSLMVDCLTIVHQNIDFKNAYLEREIIHLEDNIQATMVSYKYLREMKTRTHRHKDLEDISKLEDIQKIKYG